MLSGRSLPYGEGVTYWPLAEMVKCAAGIADDDPLDVAIEKLRAFCEDEVVADLLGLASGVLEAVQAERSQQEIAWAAREWAQRLAEEQPLVLVFEDIHWAEEPLLELIEHLATWVREAPLLLVSLARPELLDIRPGWGGGRVRATAIELEALQREESEELVEALLDGAELTERARRDLLDKTDGNPLYVEETMRMIAEEGVESVDRIPDTLQALIAARIDRLPAEAKSILQRAAVIGRVFWRAALERLSPDLESVEEPLDDLLLRDFVLDEPRSSIRGEPAYRFKHVLIREVAYAGLSKSARAELHAAFAGWLKERTGDELLEIRAFHLDRAAALSAELNGSAPVELEREAAEALAEAGLRAFAREANRTARHLFVRAVELEPTTRRRYLAASAAHRLSDLPAVSREMEAVLEAAVEEGDRWTQGRALAMLAETAVLRDADVQHAEELIEQALDVLEPDDLDGRFRALEVQATIAWVRGDLTNEEKIVREALEVARQAGRKDFESHAVDTLASVYIARLELDKAAPLIEQALLLADQSGSAEAKGHALRHAGQLYLQRRDLDAAESALESAREYLAEAGAAWSVGRTLIFAAWVAKFKGDPRALGEPAPRVDPRACAARGSCRALREPAHTRRGAPGRGPGRRGGAVRARGPRDRRPARRDVARHDHDGARPRARGPGTGRGGRGAPPRELLDGLGHRVPPPPRGGDRGAGRLPAPARPRRRGGRVRGRLRRAALPPRGPGRLTSRMTLLK